MCLKLFYSPEYVGSAHAFETTRKSRWVADSLKDSPIADVELVEPQPLSWNRSRRSTTSRTCEPVRTGEPRFLAESQGFEWDPGLWPMVLSSNGGVVAAALDALENGVSGSLSSGLHHARRGHGAGFCTFNGLAIAAREALACGAESVLILDLDAHCGGGTASLIAENTRIWQLTWPSTLSTSTPLRTRPGDGVPGCGWWRTRPTILPWSRCNCARSPAREPTSTSASTTPGWTLSRAAPRRTSRITREILGRTRAPCVRMVPRPRFGGAFVPAGGYLGWAWTQPAWSELHRLTLAAAAAASGILPKRPQAAPSVTDSCAGTDDLADPKGGG